MCAKKIAIIGSGCSSVGALWALRNKHYEIHVYERENRLGGHTNTAVFRKGQRSTPVDTGFIALNKKTYPNFLAFLEYLNIPIRQTEMSLGFSRDNGCAEWAWTSLGGLFAQPRNLFRVRFWKMILDVIRFNHFALDVIRQKNTVFGEGQALPETLEAYLQREKYSVEFKQDYLVPITASTWCTGPDVFAAQCPAEWLIFFMWNHHLLESYSNPLTWYTIEGGANTYTTAIFQKHPPARICLNAPVQSIKQQGTGKLLLKARGRIAEEYDHILLTCSAQMALQVLGDDVTEEESGILSEFKTSRNQVFLHSDMSLMPRRNAAQSGWNYITSTSAELQPKLSTAVSVTFDMNKLQHIPHDVFGPVLCSMNPIHDPDPSCVQGHWVYEHPLYTPQAVLAQKRLKDIQGVRGITFAGAWTGYGFHEDGFRSGVQVAVQFLGGQASDHCIIDEPYSRKIESNMTNTEVFVRSIIVLVIWFHWSYQRLLAEIRRKSAQVNVSLSVGWRPGTAMTPYIYSLLCGLLIGPATVFGIIKLLM